MVIGSCNNGKVSYSTPSLDIEYVKGEETRKLAVPIDINIRDRAWVEAEYNYNKDYTLNAITGDNIYSGNSHNKFTNWNISGKSNNAYSTFSGGYGWGYGYGYGSAYIYPSIELLFMKSEIPDIDKISIGSSKDKIFMTFSESDKRNVNVRSTDDYYIVWINLNNLPMKFIDELSYIKIEDN